MDDIRVSSTNQSGGVTAGTIDVRANATPPSPKRTVWRQVIKASVAVIAVLASVVAILDYLDIGPGERAPATKVEARHGDTYNVTGGESTIIVDENKPGDSISIIKDSPTVTLQKKRSHTSNVTGGDSRTMSEKKESGDTYNVTSNNQTGGITAGQINVGPQQRRLDSDGEQWLIAHIPRNVPVDVAAILGDSESYNFARQIEAFLKARGHEVNGISQVVMTGPLVGVQVDLKSTPIGLIVGHRE